MELMAAWIQGRAIGSDDFCFTLDGKPIRQETAETALKKYRKLTLENPLILVYVLSMGKMAPRVSKL